jgi:predicted Rossmann fold flavoprotein
MLKKNNSYTHKFMAGQNKIWDVIIIGGGASGLFAGVIASSRYLSVLIIEKNKNLGEKLKITGGGRCNITNSEPDIHKFLKIYGKEASFLYSPFSIFGVKDTFKFFESHNLPLVVQARNRVFPTTEKASDVLDVMQKELIKNNVAIKTDCLVKDIIYNKDKIISVKTNKGEFFAKSFILATGGMSHPETGSTGDGFRFLRNLGHSVSDPTPSIVPVKVKESWVKEISGTSLSFMKITFYLENDILDSASLIKKKKQFSRTGKILFTHFGLSGPLILNSAKDIKELLAIGKVTACIDLYPDTDMKVFEEKIIKIFDKNKNKKLKTIIKEFVPIGMASVMPKIIDFIDLEKKVHSVTKEERKRMIGLLKAIPLSITGLLGYEKAVVADGGVHLSEIDMKKMRSKKFPNLYITGDLLHITRNSGGYSLQICWTTGYIAGMSV